MKRIAVFLVLDSALGSGLVLARQRAVRVQGREAPANGKRVAPVIGNLANKRVPAPRNPVNDAQDMAAATGGENIAHS